MLKYIFTVKCEFTSMIGHVTGMKDIIQLMTGIQLYWHTCYNIQIIMYLRSTTLCTKNSKLKSVHRVQTCFTSSIVTSVTTASLYKCHLH